MLLDQSTGNPQHQGGMRAVHAGATDSPIPPPAVLRPPASPGTSLSRLAPLLREDLSQLWMPLTGTRCQAAMVPIEECAPISLAGGPTPAESPSLERCMASPISRPEGGAAGVVELRFDSAVLSHVTDRFLRAILESTVRIVKERWFRVHFSKRWVLAAYRAHGEVAQRMLFALDQDRRIMSADLQAGDAHQELGMWSKERPALSSFFALDGRRLPVAQGDVALSLRASDGLASWAAVLTPPSPVVGDRLSDQRYCWHTRPRFHLLSARGQTVDCASHLAGLTSRMLRQVQDYIDSHLPLSMSVKDLASLLGISSSYFARSFLRSTGTTPHDYIMQRRIDKARELLIGSRLPLTEIALMTGFADQPHFTRRFSQAFGMTPLRYRRSNRRE